MLALKYGTTSSIVMIAMSGPLAASSISSVALGLHSEAKI